MRWLQLQDRVSPDRLQREYEAGAMYELEQVIELARRCKTNKQLLKALEARKQRLAILGRYHHDE